ncbi:hypothetical protein PHAVU_008G125100 [Phaseolus vulgaris]|uniref:Uncharacterized protein n=1 Tax=Phaseolus vulgaris TaxID=3885 RepID=V7B4S9_PHAVU|nr:hypothetical protein PHAVU_008G125100g [Phaseolus vulgaris]ESW12580.1 hypothetical protein PHAVU_008G125100g [Phaseolus vulgaris]
MFKLIADSYWKPMMEDHLYCKDMHELISCKDKSLFEHVSTYTNFYELWSKLESMIQKKTPRNKASLVRRLVKLDYKDDQSMMEHLNSFKGITLLLLISLPESWDTLVVTLNNSISDGKISMDTVSDSLLNEESRRKERNTNFQYEANVIEKRERGETRGRNKSRLGTNLTQLNSLQNKGLSLKYSSR